MIVKIRQEKKIESKLPNSEYEMGIWKNVYYVANRKLRQNKAPQRISICGETEKVQKTDVDLNFKLNFSNRQKV